MKNEIFRFKTGKTMSGHGITEKVKPEKNPPVYGTKKKLIPEKAGINISR